MMRSGSSSPRVRLSGTGKGKGCSMLGKPASTTRAPASTCGTASEMSQRLRSCHCRTSRSAPPARARAVKVVNMIGLHDDCYHYRGLKVLSFGRCWAGPLSTQLANYPSTRVPEYPDTLSSSVSWLVGYLGFLASALTISASVEPFSFVLGVLLI